MHPTWSLYIVVYLLPFSLILVCIASPPDLALSSSSFACPVMQTERGLPQSTPTVSCVLAFQNEPLPLSSHLLAHRIALLHRQALLADLDMEGVDLERDHAASWKMGIFGGERYRELLRACLVMIRPLFHMCDLLLTNSNCIIIFLLCDYLKLIDFIFAATVFEGLSLFAFARQAEKKEVKNQNIHTYIYIQFQNERGRFP